MKNRLFLVIFSLLLTTVSIAQEMGTVKGFVFDSKTNEELAFVKVIPEGFTKFARSSDFDGSFLLKLPAGTYTLSFREGEHENFVKEVVVVAGETIEFEARMKAINTSEVVDIVYVKTKTTTSIAGLQQEVANAEGTMEMIGSEAISKTTANTVADVVSAIPAVSIVDGKDIYVRGLGDRYTKTVLNGLDIPGLDPDKNSVQMDIFPSSVIDNISVFKTFTPDLPGDFTGGVVNIVTKDFQTKKTFQVKVGLGFNTAATFNKDYISYQGGKFDFLGFDDGGRAQPISPTAKIPDPALNDTRTTLLTTKFSKTMAAERSSNFLNQNYGIVLGNQYKIDSTKNITYGYNVVANYRNNYNFIEEAQFGEYRKATERNDNALYADRTSFGQLGQNEINWSVLAGNSIRFNKIHNFSLTAFHTQNALSQAAVLEEENFESNPGLLAKQSLQYTQRSVSNLNLSGTHNLDKWKIDWKVSPTLSKIKDPDIRSTILEIIEDENGERTYALKPAVGAEIKRTFRNLTEYNFSGRFDLERSFGMWKDSLDSKIKFGGYATHKNRSFDVFDYIFLVENPTEFSGDPNFYFQNENIWNEKEDQGTYGKGEREIANTFQASQNIISGYVMHTLPITSKFEAVYGARLEKADNFYTGRTGDSDSDIKYNNQKVLNELNILPSLNLKYALRDTTRNKMNLRMAFSQTVARPSFKEKSIAQIYDPIQGRRYNGNIDLKQTTIINADARWEWFHGNTEVFSASAFYKQFTDPIEIVSFDVAPSEVKPINAGKADILGFELEIRKQVAFRDTAHEDQALFLGVNGTYVQSRIDMDLVMIDKSDEQISERTLRQQNAREGEVIGKYRSMAGQSPYIINAYVNYVDKKLGIDANLSYNVQGKRLAIVGIGRLPDVFEKPFNSLNLKISKKFGENKNWKASLSAQNILGAKRQRVYESFGSDAQIYDSFYNGRSFSASITFNLSGK